MSDATTPDRAGRRRHARGYTLTEVTIAIAVIAILAGALTPLAFKLIEDARVGRAEAEAKVIGEAIANLFKDTGYWPYTNDDGPSGRIDRLISDTNVATGAGTGAQSGAANWGSYGLSKHLGDFLYFNNPDDDSSATGANANQAGQDYPTSGQGAWRGPYTSSYSIEDPWNHAYVVNVRYMPGGRYSGSVRHKVIVLSAGPDGKWQTTFSDAESEVISGDDIGYVMHAR